MGRRLRTFLGRSRIGGHPSGDRADQPKALFERSHDREELHPSVGGPIPAFRDWAWFCSFIVCSFRSRSAWRCRSTLRASGDANADGLGRRNLPATKLESGSGLVSIHALCAPASLQFRVLGGSARSAWERPSSRSNSPGNCARNTPKLTSFFPLPPAR